MTLAMKLQDPYSYLVRYLMDFRTKGLDKIHETCLLANHRDRRALLCAMDLMGLSGL